MSRNCVPLMPFCIFLYLLPPSVTCMPGFGSCWTEAGVWSSVPHSGGDQGSPPPWERSSVAGSANAMLFGERAVLAKFLVMLSSVFKLIHQNTLVSPREGWTSAESVSFKVACLSQHSPVFPGWQPRVWGQFCQLLLVLQPRLRSVL